MILALLEISVLHDGTVKRNRGLDADHLILTQRTSHAGNRRLSGRCRGDHLGDHRIVVRRNRISGVGMGIDANASATGGVVGLDLPCAGHEILFGILRVDTAFDRMQPGLCIDDMVGKMLSGSHLDLLLHKITTVDLFGHWVFHLNAGVHLHEVEVQVVIDEVLDGAGIVVSDGLTETDRSLTHSLAEILRHERGGTLLEDFLIAALKRAVALTEMDDFAVLVSENLELDVVRIDNELLDIDIGVTEGLFCLHAGAVISGNKGGLVVGHAHPATTATGDGLDHDGIADLFSHLDGFQFALHHAIASG